MRVISTEWHAVPWRASWFSRAQMQSSNTDVTVARHLKYVLNVSVVFLIL